MLKWLFAKFCIKIELFCHSKYFEYIWSKLKSMQVKSMQVTSQFNFQNLPFIGSNAPNNGQQLTVSQVKKINDILYYRFQQFDRNKMKVYFNSINFS